LPSLAPASPAIGAAAEASAVNVYGGFWRRVGASFIDSLILYAVMFVVILAMAIGETGNEADSAAAGLWAVLASNVFAWLYSALLESSSRQATLGKMAFGIRVTDLDGQRIGFGRATGRYFGKIVSSIAFGIGFVMAGFTQRRQALHDKIARTLVLRKDTDVERLAAHPIAPKVATWAVALLILVAAVVPVTGMLAAIAIPAYQDYTIRTQVADGLASAAAYKAAVAEAVASDLDWENITTEALGLEAQPSSQYLASTEVVMGVVVLTFSDAANSNIAGGQLLLVPGLSEGGDVVWVCGYGAAPDGVELVIDKHEQYTDVERKYLPAACRS
jgi:uncharacterized RDD family membrane protein YckC/Tfp pilus assembly major pilin PilA